MRTKLFFCALLLGACTLSAQNITLSPEAGVSVVRRPPSGEDWRPAAKVGVAVDFNLTKHFGIESGLFYAFRHYQIDNGGIYSNDDATWMEPYVGLCVKTKVDGNQRLLKGSFPGPTGQYYDGFVYGEDEAGNSNLFLYDKDRKFDWGVTANVGVEIRNWYTKLQYDLSLGKENKRDAIDANYHTLTLSVGYKFHL